MELISGDINEETGLPELPEGMFWRVRLTSGSFSDSWYALFGEKKVRRLVVELRELTGKKNKSRQVSEEWIQVSGRTSGIDWENMILELSVRIVRIHNRMIKDALAEEDGEESLLAVVGDYPPKKIGKEIDG